MPQAIHISPIDNVVVALHPIAKGTLVEVDGLAVTALEDIPQGHKMAVKPIKNGENVIKYGFPIGHATADAEPGTWMHTHNVHTNLSGEVEYSYHPAPDLAPLPKVEPETFMGFRRKDGRAAIRNEIWIIPTVGCVNDIAKKYNVEVGTFGHAGDGNLHPTFLCDKRDKEEFARVEAAVDEMFDVAISLHGTLSGEHGIGTAKSKWMEKETSRGTILFSQRLRRALDPKGLLNPTKLVGI